MEGSADCASAECEKATAAMTPAVVLFNFFIDRIRKLVRAG